MCGLCAVAARRRQFALRRSAVRDFRCCPAQGGQLDPDAAASPRHQHSVYRLQAQTRSRFALASVASCGILGHVPFDSVTWWIGLDMIRETSLAENLAIFRVFILWIRRDFCRKIWFDLNSCRKLTWDLDRPCQVVCLRAGKMWSYATDLRPCPLNRNHGDVTGCIVQLSAACCLLPALINV